jgi:glycosyltransferase involved in cell wall biosynthesis
MRIGFDAKRAFNNHTGLGNYSRFVIDSLLTFFPQHEYYLFTPGFDSQLKDYFAPRPNLHIISPEGIIDKTFASAWRSFGLVKELEKYKIDVFHGLSNELPNGIEQSIIKSIVSIHDLIFLRYPDYYNNIDAYIYKKKFRNACEHATHIVSVSEQTKQDIMSYFHTNPSKISVVYQDCDKQFYEKQSESKKQNVINKYNLPEQFFLTVGTIEKRKNQLSILKAIASLKDTSIKLVVVGKATEYKKLLDEFIITNNMQEQITFVPKVDFADLPAMFQLANCAIYISEFEGFGIPVLEALRCEVPNIASNVSSIPEVAGDAALLCSPTDVETLAKHMAHVHSNPVLRLDLIEKGKLQAEKINPQHIAEDLLKIYST